MLTRYLTDTLLIVFLAIFALAFGAKSILDWDNQRLENTRTVAYHQGFVTKQRQEDYYDEGYCDARDKYKKDNDTFAED